MNEIGYELLIIIIIIVLIPHTFYFDRQPNRVLSALFNHGVIN